MGDTLNWKSGKCRGDKTGAQSLNQLSDELVIDLEVTAYLHDIGNSIAPPKRTRLVKRTNQETIEIDVWNIRGLCDKQTDVER